MYKYKRVRTPKICALPDCERPRWSALRCGRHAEELKQTDPAEFERLGRLVRENPKAAEHEGYMLKHRLPHPKYEYTVTDEQTEALIKICSQQSQKHPRVGFFRPAAPLEEENQS
jgi:hypothetical protein